MPRRCRRRSSDPTTKNQGKARTNGRAGPGTRIQRRLGCGSRSHVREMTVTSTPRASRPPISCESCTSIPPTGPTSCATIVTGGVEPCSCRRPMTLHHHWQGAHQDQAVAPERPAADVLVVELDHLVERDVAAAEHLPQPGDSGTQVQAARRPAVNERVLVE